MNKLISYLREEDGKNIISDDMMGALPSHDFLGTT